MKNGHARAPFGKRRILPAAQKYLNAAFMIDNWLVKVENSSCKLCFHVHMVCRGKRLELNLSVGING